MPTAKWYRKGYLNLHLGNIDLANHDIKVMLSDSSITPDQANAEIPADVVNEVVGTGYVAGGKSLANKLLFTSGDTVVFDADDVLWATSTITARHAHIYDATANLLIGFISADADVSSTSGDFTIPWDPLGIISDPIL